MLFHKCLPGLSYSDAGLDPSDMWADYDPTAPTDLDDVGPHNDDEDGIRHKLLWQLSDGQ